MKGWSGEIGVLNQCFCTPLNTSAIDFDALWGELISKPVLYQIKMLICVDYLICTPIQTVFFFISMTYVVLIKLYFSFNNLYCMYCICKPINKIVYLIVVINCVYLYL